MPRRRPTTPLDFALRLRSLFSRASTQEALEDRIPRMLSSAARHRVELKVEVKDLPEPLLAQLRDPHRGDVSVRASWWQDLAPYMTRLDVAGVRVL